VGLCSLPSHCPKGLMGSHSQWAWSVVELELIMESRLAELPEGSSE
jgi:hypothetical protein